mmetsp:Transcript_10837/g.20996  ORF Transcript_10837/g.20996 Transcript_10837/m.20996 type:complete len:216 (+) Transcript_10837:2-649(+)
MLFCRYEAYGGIWLYEHGRLLMSNSTVEWVSMEGEGLRLWDHASAVVTDSTFRYNGVDVGFNLAPTLSIRGCEMYGSELGALWAMGEVSNATVEVRECEIYGVDWRSDAAMDALPLHSKRRDTEPPGCLVWENVTLRPEKPRPRTWRPLCKREPTARREAVMWSSTDSVPDEEAQDPWEPLNIPEMALPVALQPYDHVLAHFYRRDAARDMRKRG